ncbi:MAG: HIT family protein [Hyphomonadaceae bacterium]|nr:HIT family protein [Hyphomonadaceae bacterium]
MSLTGTYDDANIFAKILRGELPCIKAFEDEVALAFMDIFPQGRGHTLVIPKGAQARNLLDFPAEMFGPYLERVQRVARAVTAALEPDGFQILQFNGAPAGQTVFHLHFHIIPRWDSVALAGHGHARRADDAELQDIARAIAAAM